MITLATLKDATAQEVFNQVALHLLTQGERSLSADRDDMCTYRGTGGLMCAGGCLIADSEYNPRMDTFGGDTGWESLIMYGVFPNHHEDLITALQALHDNADPYLWSIRLTELAIRRKLSYDVVTNFGEFKPKGV